MYDGPSILIEIENSTGYFLSLGESSTYGAGTVFDNDAPPVALMEPYSIYQFELDRGASLEFGGSLLYFILEDGQNAPPVSGVTTSFKVNFNHSSDGTDNTCSHILDGKNKDDYNFPDPNHNDIQGDVASMSWTLTHK
jgi:hypothetical protein